MTGPNVTEVFKLSRYNPNLEGTIGDSDVYVLKGEKEGGYIPLFFMASARAAPI